MRVHAVAVDMVVAFTWVVGVVAARILVAVILVVAVLSTGAVRAWVARILAEAAILVEVGISAEVASLGAPAISAARVNSIAEAAISARRAHSQDRMRCVLMRAGMSAALSTAGLVMLRGRHPGATALQPILIVRRG